jgi:hypothetical protein
LIFKILYSFQFFQASQPFAALIDLNNTIFPLELEPYQRYNDGTVYLYKFTGLHEGIYTLWIRNVASPVCSLRIYEISSIEVVYGFATDVALDYETSLATYGSTSTVWIMFLIFSQAFQLIPYSVA